MINDLLINFKGYFDDSKVIIDTYKLQNGKYYLFSKTGNFLNYLNVDKNTDITSDLYNYFKIRDYYSNYMDSNKAIENKVSESCNGKKYNMSKKICSNNYLTLFFKNCFVEGINGKYADSKEVPVEIFKKGIVDYYRALMEKNLKNKKEKEILESIKQQIVSDDEILKTEKNMLNIFEQTLNIIKNEISREANSVKKACFIKIFIEATEEEYEEASNKYLYLRIFNTNNNNIFKYNEIYGVNNYNYGLNSKKPFLELKTTSYKNSFVSQKNIKAIRNMYIWLLKIISPLDYAIIPVNYDFKSKLESINKIDNKDVYLLNVENNKGSAVIKDFEYIPNFCTSIRPFVCKNFINNKLSNFDEKNLKVEQNICNLYQMQKFISNVWFSGYLETSYFKYDEKIKKLKEVQISGWKKRMLLEHGNIFKNAFLNQNSLLLKNKLNKVGKEVVINYLKEQLPKMRKNYLSSTKKAMNLWIALNDYFNKEENMSNKLRDAIDIAKMTIKNKSQIKSDEVYYAVLGQVAYYLISQTKADGPDMDILDPILECNNVAFLKKRLELLHKKYAYSISLYNTEYKNALSELLIYEPEKTVKENTDILLASLLSDNVFYQSKKEENK